MGRIGAASTSGILCAQREKTNPEGSDIVHNILEIPNPIIKKVDELNDLIERNPLYIPIPELARFLGANPDSLRASIEHGQCPFGFPWQKDMKGYRSFKVPTVTFYLWYTNGGPFRWQAKKEESA